MIKIQKSCKDTLAFFIHRKSQRLLYVSMLITPADTLSHLGQRHVWILPRNSRTVSFKNENMSKRIAGCQKGNSVTDITKHLLQTTGMHL